MFDVRLLVEFFIIVLARRQVDTVYQSLQYQKKLEAKNISSRNVLQL